MPLFSSFPPSSSLNDVVLLQACQGPSVARFRGWRGTSPPLALLWFRNTCVELHPRFRSGKALQHVPVSNTWILLLTSIQVLGACELSTCRSAFLGSRFCHSSVRECLSICRQACYNFFFFFFKEGDSHLMVFMALLDVALTVWFVCVWTISFSFLFSSGFS